MGMSTHVKAFISLDDPIYKKQADVLKACNEAEVSLPKETATYFGSTEPDLYLLEEKLEIEIHKQDWQDDDAQGYEILVKDIPEGTYKIRFYNSW